MDPIIEEKQIRTYFLVSIFLKGAISFAECVAGIAAFFVPLPEFFQAALNIVSQVLDRSHSPNVNEKGTNFKAWIFTILRNLYFNEFRRNRALMRPLEAADLEIHATAPSQQAGLEFDDFRRAFRTLPPEQREALVLVGADGFRYEEAAAICGCPVGTIKSRVARARGEIVRLLGTDDRPASSGHEPNNPPLPRRRAARTKSPQA